MITDIYCVV